MVVAVVAAPISSLIALGIATVEAHAGFPSAAACHANGRQSALQSPRMCPIRLGTHDGCTGVALHCHDGSRPAFVFLLNMEGRDHHPRAAPPEAGTGQGQDTNSTGARDRQRRQARAGQAGKEGSKLDSKFSSSGRQLVARPAKGGVVALPDYDPTRVNELMPHPIYAWMRWVQILSPKAER